MDVSSVTARSRSAVAELRHPDDRVPEVVDGGVVDSGEACGAPLRQEEILAVRGRVEPLVHGYPRRTAAALADIEVLAPPTRSHVAGIRGVLIRCLAACGVLELP